MEETSLKLLSWCRCNEHARDKQREMLVAYYKQTVCRLPNISHFRVTQSLCFEMSLRACIHGGGGPQLGAVTCVRGVTRLFIQCLILIWLCLHERWGDPPHVTSPIWGSPTSMQTGLKCKAIDMKLSFYSHANNTRFQSESLTNSKMAIASLPKAQEGRRGEGGRGGGALQAANGLFLSSYCNLGVIFLHKQVYSRNSGLIYTN